MWIPQRRKHQGIGRRVDPRQFVVITEPDESNIPEAALTGTRTQAGLIDAVASNQETRVEIRQALICGKQIVNALASPQAPHIQERRPQRTILLSELVPLRTPPFAPRLPVFDVDRLRNRVDPLRIDAVRLKSGAARRTGGLETVRAREERVLQTLIEPRPWNPAGERGKVAKGDPDAGGPRGPPSGQERRFRVQRDE